MSWPLRISHLPQLKKIVLSSCLAGAGGKSSASTPRGTTVVGQNKVFESTTSFAHFEQTISSLQDCRWFFSNSLNVSSSKIGKPINLPDPMRSAIWF